MDWIIENVEWLFSGIAIAIPIAIIGWFFSGKKFKQIQWIWSGGVASLCNHDINEAGIFWYINAVANLTLVY